MNVNYQNKSTELDSIKDDDIANNIVMLIKKKFDTNIIAECLDINQLISICTLYKNHRNDDVSISLRDIDFSSPEFDKKSGKKMSSNILETSEFKKKYTYFIKFIYSCIKLDVDIFNINPDRTLTFKNNYHLVKSIELRKKNIILDHIETLKSHHRNASHKINQQYYAEYVPNYFIKIKILDKMLEGIRKMIKNNIMNNTDNLFELILPYFYTYRQYIEEYNK